MICVFQNVADARDKSFPLTPKTLRRAALPPAAHPLWTSSVIWPIQKIDFQRLSSRA
jgi:hypothetical protein